MPLFFFWPQVRRFYLIIGFPTPPSITTSFSPHFIFIYLLTCIFFYIILWSTIKSFPARPNHTIAIHDSAPRNIYRMYPPRPTTTHVEWISAEEIWQTPTIFCEFDHPQHNMSALLLLRTPVRWERKSPSTHQEHSASSCNITCIGV